jgi:hypothetical protein
VRKGLDTFRIALLCAEKDPISCHRTILVCRHLRAGDLEIQHILEDGTLESGAAAERRLMRVLKIPEADFFLSPAQLLESAYDRQSQRVAYVEDEERNAHATNPAVHHRVHEEERP